jgi:delta24-sterol reductase
MSLDIEETTTRRSAEATAFMQRQNTPFKAAVRRVHRQVAQVLTVVWVYFVLPVLRVLGMVGRVVYKLILEPLTTLLQNSSLYEPMLDFFTRHRGWVLLGFVLPLSFLFDKYFVLRNWYYHTFLSTPHLHDERVKYVQRQVRTWHAAGRKRPMVTARPTWMAMSLRVESFKEACEKIDISLYDILEIDTERRVVRCEPSVDMGQITRYLIPRGYALAVMVEMDDLTVGGLLMGIGVEVSSHIYGFLFETVEAFEVVLGDGSLVRATREENSDLFHALPWSHGTLGFLVAVELRIVPVKPYVHTRYIPCHSQDEYIKKVEELVLSPNPPEFIEMTVYSKESAVIFTGDFSDGPPKGEEHKINPINRWYKPWFFKHVEEYLTTGPGEEWIPLRHYYHRHTRSIFWELRELVPFGNEWWYRWFFGWLGAPKIAFIKMTSTEAVRQASVYQRVVQDIIAPLPTLRDSINLFDDAFGVYPLLFYPVRIYEPELKTMMRKPRHIHGEKEGRKYGMFYDLGVYGVPPKVKRKEHWDAIHEVRRMEEYTRKVGGYQLLYADCFMSRAEFEQMFDHTLYRECRRKYHAEGAFPEVYDKIRCKYAPAAKED